MKQYFTGFFTAICLTSSMFLFMGSKKTSHGDIVAESILIKNPKTGLDTYIEAGIITLGKNGKGYVAIGAGDKAGTFGLLGENGPLVLMGIGATSDEGFICTYNNKNDVAVQLGTFGDKMRGLSIHDENSVTKSFIGIDEKNSGRIILANKNREPAFSAGATYDYGKRGVGYIHLGDQFGDTGWSAVGD